MQAKKQRQQTLSDVRRALVLEAARSVFLEAGIEGANIRAIAKRAGYTPGAIYSYFDSKEAIYGALLAQSLEKLNAVVALARGVKNRPDKTLLAKARAWFGFYAENPRDLDLGFYLVQGMKPRGLTADLNSQLNERLRDALRPHELALLDMGLCPAGAARESAALFAHGVGLLLLQHTGRIRLFGQDVTVLFDLYLEQLLMRCKGSLTEGQMTMTETAVPPQTTCLVKPAV